jgi:hypothetical protein
VRLLQVLQDRFVWVSSCDADRQVPSGVWLEIEEGVVSGS